MSKNLYTYLNENDPSVLTKEDLLRKGWSYHPFVRPGGIKSHYMEYGDFFLNIKGDKFYTENGFEMKSIEMVDRWIEGHGVKFNMSKN